MTRTALENISQRPITFKPLTDTETLLTLMFGWTITAGCAEKAYSTIYEQHLLI